MKRVRSPKTTMAGLAVGVSLIAFAVQDAMEDGSWDGPDWALLAGGIGAAAAGFYSRDDNVSSEGVKIPKTPN